MNKYLCRPWVITLMTLLLIFFDQATKGLAVRFLKGQEPFVIWDGVFELRYLENRGAAFGMLQGHQAFFLFTGLLVFAAALYFFRHVSADRKFFPIRMIAVFILAGALGNMADRLRLSYVVDFFYFRLIDFPIFNVADIYVSVGTAVLAVLILFYYKEEELNRLLDGRKKGAV
ncbi:MAG: signal peptidase II [Lachnospiraceae bacterium]|jgi:signal peptidase II|nr:signal peptidase II [Lachnospiraceae bacterium]MCI9600443.1 signal peptidase II [Lachnospiraceae bacterium]